MLTNTNANMANCAQPNLLVPPAQPIPVFGVYQNGSIKCAFDMFCRWPQQTKRLFNPFLYRGDRYGVTEAPQMLRNHLKNFIKNYRDMTYAVIWDNTRPENDVERIVLEWNNGSKDNRRLEHKLQNYPLVLENFPLPDWLK